MGVVDYVALMLEPEVSLRICKGLILIRDHAFMHLHTTFPLSCMSLQSARLGRQARTAQTARAVARSPAVHHGHAHVCSHTAGPAAHVALAERLRDAFSKCLSAAVAVSLLLGQPAAQAEVGLQAS
jgi:hypothetical protein